MIIGKLNKRVVIKYPATASDGQGGRVTTWTTKYTVWAQINVPRQSVESVQGAVSSELTHEVLIRKIDENMVGYKVYFGSHEYEVLHSYDNLYQGTVLQCREVIKR